MRNVVKNLYKLKFLKRAVPSLLKIIIKIFNIKRIQVDHNDLKFNLNPKNPIDREIYLKDNYEIEQIKFLGNEIDKNNIRVFIDVGAHMGFYSINLSKKKIEIYSFEPIKNNFNQLEENISINKIKNISVFNCALSNKKEIIKMWVPNKDKTGGFSVYDKNDEELKKYEKKNNHIEISRSDLADNLLSFKDIKIAIKIDVERHEEEVLLGMTELIKNNRMVIQIEILEKRKKRIFYILEK